MEHAEFIRLFGTHKVVLTVDRTKALQAASNGSLGRGYQAAYHFYAWVWIAGVLAAIPVAIFYIWWLGVIIFVLSVGIPKAIRKTATDEVREKVERDPQFFEFAQANGLIEVRQTDIRQ